VSIERISTELRTCACGCAQVFPFYTGLLRYQTDRTVAFRAAHLFHSGPHLWLLLGSGPWFKDDLRGCWLNLHTWIAEGKVIGRIEEPEESPFLEGDVFGERRLTRAEVLAQEGALDWAIARRDELVQLHEPTRNFLNRAVGA
jgi:hypothetical protein